MVTGLELSMAAMDDRRYLYPHVWSPPLTPLRYPQIDAAWAREQWPPEAPPGQRDDARGTAGPPLDDGIGHSVERAVIGDALRIPIVWCDFGSCIARFTDGHALGQSDVRRRAIAAGWRQDALGRLACQECVQRDATFMVVYPLVKSEGERQDAGPGAAKAVTAAEDPRVTLEPSAWDSVELPRLNLAVTAQRERSKLGRWGRRDAGRHRWQ